MLAEEVMDLLVAYWNGELGEEELVESFDEPTYINPHGKCIDAVQAAYGDWYIYEDGYEEFKGIGD